MQLNKFVLKRIKISKAFFFVPRIIARLQGYIYVVVILLVYLTGYIDTLFTERLAFMSNQRNMLRCNDPAWNFVLSVYVQVDKCGRGEVGSEMPG